VKTAFKNTRVPRLRVIAGGRPGSRECPYFDLTNKALECPFAGATEDEKVSGIRDVCAEDEEH